MPVAKEKSNEQPTVVYAGEVYTVTEFLRLIRKADKTSRRPLAVRRFRDMSGLLREA